MSDEFWETLGSNGCGWGKHLKWKYLTPPSNTYKQKIQFLFFLLCSNTLMSFDERHHVSAANVGKFIQTFEHDTGQFRQCGITPRPHCHLNQFRFKPDPTCGNTKRNRWACFSLMTSPWKHWTFGFKSGWIMDGLSLQCSLWNDPTCWALTDKCITFTKVNMGKSESVITFLFSLSSKSKAGLC